MKTCTRCSEEKELELFARRSRSSDGRSSWCKECYKKYDRDRYQFGDDKIRKATNKERTKTIAREYIWEYLLGSSCVDCSETDPLVLEFDHRDGSGKERNISDMLGLNLNRIKAEIAKCDVRCANCHRRRTIKQLGFWRGKM